MQAEVDTRDVVGRIRERVWRECDPAVILAAGGEAEPIVRELAAAIMREERIVLPAVAADAVIEDVVAATIGLGPLDQLLRDPSISEIMVNGPGSVYVERGGVIEQVDVCFHDDEHVRQVIDRMLAPIGRRLDALSPMVDARLRDGSRINAIVPPLAVDGPAVTIRRFLQAARSLDDLVGLESMTPEQRSRIEALVDAHANVLVAGGTGSGKTTLLAAALASCPVTERIIVIEDAAELPIDNPHRVRLEARPPTWEARGEVTVRDLVRNSLRMRPDRIVVGEVRGAETFDLLQALNTGHRGCWSTVHANGPQDALVRIEAMALAAGTGVPHSVIRAQVASAFDAIIHVGRSPDGRRHVADVVDVSSGDDVWSLAVEPDA